MPNDEIESEDHIFLKPKNAVYPKMKTGGSGGIPPIWVPHEEGDEGYKSRREKGINSLLNGVIVDNEQKVLRDNMAYFVVDFKIKGDHPTCSAFIDKINARLLTFLDRK